MKRQKKYQCISPQWLIGKKKRPERWGKIPKCFSYLQKYDYWAQQWVRAIELNNEKMQLMYGEKMNEVSRACQTILDNLRCKKLGCPNGVPGVCCFTMCGYPMQCRALQPEDHHQLFARTTSMVAAAAAAVVACFNLIIKYR